MRLPVLFFREGAWVAALEGAPSVSEAHRADPFGNEAHTAGPLHCVVFPGAARHGFVTGGARVCQVRVNPPGRAVVVVGVDVVERPSDPWPEKARLAALRKGRRRLAARGSPWARRRSDGTLVCSGDAPLQKLTSGTWPARPGEQPVSAWV